MQERNRLQAGNYVEPLPIGLPVTIQYKDTGVLECAYVGYNEQSWHTDATIYETLIKKNLVPAHIEAAEGTFLIRGVLYSGIRYKSEGTLPFCLEDEIIQNLQDGLDYNFFAGHIASTSTKFAGHAQMRTWLQTHKFNLLPGFVVPHNESEASIQKMLENTGFDPQLVFGYFIFDAKAYSIEFTDIALAKINGWGVYLDESGFIHYKVNYSFGDRTYSYYEGQKHNIQNANCFLLDEHNEIIADYPSTQVLETSFEYSCPICGKIYQVSDEFTRCPDPHCLSVMYPEIKHFISVLDLPEMTYSSYAEHAYVEKDLTKLQDLFSISPYEDLEIVTSIYDLLNAIVPVFAVRKRDTIWQLVSQCNSSWDSISYYIENPQKMLSDLDIDDTSLMDWLLDEFNRNTVLDVVAYTNIVLGDEKAKFEGDPILRNLHVFLTGKFKHGSYTELASILKSYGAEVVPAEKANCCLIGDIPEDVEGYKVNMLRDSGAHVYHESSFFLQYDIDSDLS